MERSGNFYKAIRLGYILISILIGCMAYNSLYEWQEIEALELGNKKIDELRKEINNINIQMIKFSLLGETILEWNDKDIEHYHARRMAMDSMLCRFKATYPAERIDSVRSLLEDKERQMFQIVRLMDEQQSINKKIANQIPVIVQKSVQEQSKKPKRKGFLGIFGKKKEVTPAVSTTILHSVNRNVISEQKVQDRQFTPIPRDKKNPNNGHVRFILDKERSLRAWMTENLIFHYLPNDKPKQVESDLIRQFNPPLNLSGNENPVNQEFQSKLSSIRGQRPWKVI